MTMFLNMNFRLVFFVSFICVVLFSFQVAALSADDAAIKPKIIIPEDAIIVPYLPDNITPNKLPKPELLKEADQTIIIPLELHHDMLDLIKSFDEIRLNPQQSTPPTRIAAVAAEYTAAELPQTGNELILAGKIHIYHYRDEGTLLPFNINNCVIESPQLNNKPASISSTSNSQFVLHINGKGEHVFAFNVRIKIQQQGGWRIADGILPNAVTSKVQITLPAEEGDLITGNPLDIRKWSSGKDKSGANKKITTTLDKNGKFTWRWRSAISEGQVDRSLEIESVIRFDLQDDAAWILWTPKFKISRGKWEMLRLQVPKNYAIAEVTGENVRGWNIVTKNTETNSDKNKTENTQAENAQIINIELLKPAEKEEILQIRLLKNEPDEKINENELWKLSTLSVPEAGIHRGRIDIYRSAVRTFRVTQSNGAALTDQPQTPVATTTAKFNAASPLGITPFQSYRFSAEPFDLKFQSSLQPKTTGVNFKSVLKIARKRSILETKIEIRTNNKPFFVTINLPKQFKLKNVTAPDTIFHSAEKKDDNNLLYISHGNNVEGIVEIWLEGDYIPITPAKFNNENNKKNIANTKTLQYKIEQLPVFSADFAGIKSNSVDKYATIELLADPSFKVEATDLKNCKLVDRKNWENYLDLTSEQWELVQLVIGIASKDAEAKLLFTEIEPNVQCSTITNVKATGESINETILFDFNINRAGIREVKFLLPAWMKDAVIETPFLQRKIIKEIEIKNNKETEKLIDVTLELQESVIDHLRVLVHADRKLYAEQNYKITTPILKTGNTTSQYVVMENDRLSPDEMVVEQPTIKNLKNLDRRQEEWHYLASMLGNNVTEAYYAQKINTNNQNNETALIFKMKRRNAIQLSEARINKAETRLVFDSNGEYRAEQIYHIDNQKEPYLDIFLPENATLWGVRFFTADEWQKRDTQQNNPNIIKPEGSPVKPCEMQYSLAKKYNPNIKETISKNNNNTANPAVRIPLIKTESGDLDYVVRIVYGGAMRKLNNLSSAEMPFIKVMNVPVGTSLLKLYLPEKFRYLFYGNMQQISRDQTTTIIKQINDNYTQQINDRLQKTIKEDNVYAQQRALSNIAQNANINQELNANNFSNNIAQSNQQATQTQVPQTIQQIPIDNQQENFNSNSATLRNQYESQSNTLSGQIVNQKSAAIQNNINFKGNNVKSPENNAIPKTKSDFNEEWLKSVKPEDKEYNAAEVMNNSFGGAIQNEKSAWESSKLTNSTAKGKGDNVNDMRRSQAVFKGNIVLGNTEQINRQLAISNEETPESSKYGKFKNKLSGQPTPQNDSSPEPQSISMYSSPFNVNIDENTSGSVSGIVNSQRLEGNNISEKANAGSGSAITVEDQISFEGNLRANSGAVGYPMNRAISVPPAPEGNFNSQFRTLSTRMTGLDIDVPYNGVLYVFTTPQGSLDLSFRALSDDAGVRFFWFMAALILIGIIYAFYNGFLFTVNRFVFDRKINFRFGILFTLLMFLSLLAGLLIIFVLALIVTIILWINFFRTKEAAE
ncbi:MAG: hypothetical protein LBP59_17720 [Planctomycetaceae bacterium]|nr:hypothetical protein [Planctomycetaceae bacterium]